MMKDLIERIDKSFDYGFSDDETTTVGRVTWKQLKAYIVSLEDNCSVLEEKNDCLDEHNERIESNAKWLGKMVDELEKENNDLRTQLMRLEGENGDLRSQLIKRW